MARPTGLSACGSGIGWDRLMLVGDAPYYSRFGFSQLRDVVMPPPTNPERVLGIGPWTGIVGDVSRAGDSVTENVAPIRQSGSSAP